MIAKALELGGYHETKTFTGINGGTEVSTGFAHGVVLSLADTVINNLALKGEVCCFGKVYVSGSIPFITP